MGSRVSIVIFLMIVLHIFYPFFIIAVFDPFIRMHKTFNSFICFLVIQGEHDFACECKQNNVLQFKSTNSCSFFFFSNTACSTPVQRIRSAVSNVCVCVGVVAVSIVDSLIGVLLLTVLTY